MYPICLVFLFVFSLKTNSFIIQVINVVFSTHEIFPEKDFFLPSTSAHVLYGNLFYCIKPEIYGIYNSTCRPFLSSKSFIWGFCFFI